MNKTLKKISIISANILCITALCFAFSAFLNVKITADNSTTPAGGASGASPTQNTASSSSTTAPTNPAGTNIPAPAIPAAANNTPKNSLKASSTPQPQAPNTNALITPLANVQNQPASQPNKANISRIALIAVATAAFLAFMASLFLRRTKIGESGGGDNSDNEGSEDEKNKKDPCAKIREQLERKKAELNQTSGEIATQQSLADKIKEKIQEKAQDKLQEKTTDALLERAKNETLEKSATIVESAQDAYYILTEKWEDAQQILKGLRAKTARLQGEVQTLEAAYNECMLTATSRNAATGLIADLELPKNMKIHIVMHESFEAPAAIETWAKNKEHQVTYTRLYAGDKFPENFDFDFLVVMGGPQSPATTTEECPHFDSKKEIAFIKKAIDENKKVFGACLGAQMIGEALGAKFEHSPNKEIGVFEIELTEAGKRDPIISSFPEKFMVSHWHGDMPGLTNESEVLAISKGCPRQIVRYSPKIYGFQCHFEFTPMAIEGMIENSTAELEKYKGLPYIQNAEQLKANDYSEMNNLLFKFLDYMESI
jgi:GMP synthase (glutamine-hydrolysing)